MNIRTARDVGAAIKQARKARGYSQTALAKEIGVHQPKISAAERGAPGMRLGLVLQILRTLNLEVTIKFAVEPAPSTKRKRNDDDDHVVDLDKIANTGLD